MAKLGTARTRKFSIGTAEMRIGAMTAAMGLKQSDSIGLLDNVTVEVTQESVDLNGGFPKVLVDTAIISQEAQITATLREYSRRNMQVLLGDGVQASVVDSASTITTDETSDIGPFTIAADEGFVDDDIVVIYPEARPEELTVARIETVTTGTTITLHTGTPMLFDYPGTTETIHIFKAHQVSIGNIEQTNYFACQVLQLERATGRPIGFDFWKATVASGMTYATNAEDFASTELVVKLLQPSAEEYSATGDLLHISDIIAGTDGVAQKHPTGMYYAGGDT